MSRDLVVSAPLAFFAVVFAVVITLWLVRAESPVVHGAPAASSAALLPELKKAAEAGDAVAQFKLAEALLQDPERNAESSANAVRWLQVAAESGNTEAMIFLGRMSRTGVGVLQNFGQSASWLQTAAARGNPEGMLELGRLYRDGVGVGKDPVLAYVWFNRASAARNLDAVRERDAIARTLTPEELKDAQNKSSAHDAESEKSPDKPAGKG